MAIDSQPLSGIERGNVVACVHLQACEKSAISSKRKRCGCECSAGAALAWLAITAAIALLFQQHCPEDYVVSWVLLHLPISPSPLAANLSSPVVHVAPTRRCHMVTYLEH
jgi:hypothetical protein